MPLIIRNEQLETFRLLARKRFEDDMVAHVRTSYPDQYGPWGDAGTRELVRGAVRKGAALGITARGAVAVLIELMVEVGREFELSPERQWAHAVLANPELPGHVKVDVVQARIRARTLGRKLVRHRSGMD
ncbi:MAG: hypothetical protein V4476_20640 [Pseudomonadota bacterium]